MGSLPPSKPLTGPGLGFGAPSGPEVKGDGKQKADETFYLDLFDNSSNALFTKKRGTSTILNDD